MIYLEFLIVLIKVLITIEIDVSFTIHNHQITKIKLFYHKNEQGLKVEVVPETHSLDVATVSEATSSNNIILEAMDNALEDIK